MIFFLTVLVQLFAHENSVINSTDKSSFQYIPFSETQFFVAYCPDSFGYFLQSQLQVFLIAAQLEINHYLLYESTQDIFYSNEHSHKHHIS